MSAGECVAKDLYSFTMEERRKHVIGIMAAIMAARKLSQQEMTRQVPVTVAAISDAVLWAERIMQEIDRRWPTGKVGANAGQ